MKTTLILALLLLTACNVLNNFGDYVAGMSTPSTMNYSCTYSLNASGVAGTGQWSICNLPSSLETPGLYTRLFPPQPGACGIVMCDTTADRVHARAVQLLGRDDPGIVCLQRGDNVLTVGQLPDIIPCVVPGEADCLPNGEPCQAGGVFCCEPSVCEYDPHVTEIGRCCVSERGPCKASTECCQPQGGGCVDGSCACVPHGGACVGVHDHFAGCCDGPCDDGVCCVGVGGVCEIDADCCAGLACSLNTCD